MQIFAFFKKEKESKTERKKKGQAEINFGGNQHSATNVVDWTCANPVIFLYEWCSAVQKQRSYKTDSLCN